MRQYEVGDKVRFDLTFKRAGVGVDPTTVTLKVKSPAAVTTTYTYAGGTITRSAVGKYYAESTTAAGEAGLWLWRVEATGDDAVVEQGDYVVIAASI